MKLLMMMMMMMMTIDDDDDDDDVIKFNTTSVPSATSLVPPFIYIYIFIMKSYTRYTIKRK